MKTDNIKGFTLIELLVVISMLIIITSGALAINAESRDVGRINRATVQLESMIKEAQAFGNSGRASPPTDASDPASFDRGYGIYVRRNSDEIIMYGGDDNDFNTTVVNDEFYNGGKYVHETLTFEGGVEITRIQVRRPNNSLINNRNSVSILFRRGDEIARIHAQAGANRNLKEAIITLSAGALEKKVHVNAEGLIYSE